MLAVHLAQAQIIAGYFLPAGISLTVAFACARNALEQARR